MRMGSLLKVLPALDVSLAEFFREGLIAQTVNLKGGKDSCFQNKPLLEDCSSHSGFDQVGKFRRNCCFK